MQGAREALLAYASLAGQQHRDLGLRSLLHQRVSLAKSRRDANQLTALTDRRKR